MNIDYYKLYDIDYYEDFSRFIKFFDDIKDDKFDIEEVLPDHLIERFKRHLEEKKSYLESRDDNFKYLSLYELHNFLFESLEAARVDLLAFKAFIEIEKNESIISNLKSFKMKNSFCKKVIYERCNNVTGRLVVKEGPRILTLPSRYRSILKSRFDEGEVYSIDFSALEPRITAKLSGVETKKDIYEEILNLLSFNADRSIIKKAVISSIYGANYTSLEGLSLERSKEIFDQINKYFDFKKILEISSNIDEIGIRRNYFGRPLWNLSEKRENVLINNYIQSTAVDISLTYFTNLIKKINFAKPLFILHDALIIDLDQKDYDVVRNEVDSGYNDSKLGYFPLKLEKFNI